MARIRKSGGYRKLASFQTTTIIYDATVWFCEKFLDDRKTRTVDQMVQAARSGRQNIAEGSRAGATSSHTELRLVNVARSSLEELLLDFEDYLRHRRWPQWAPNSPEAMAVRNVPYRWRNDLARRTGQINPTNRSNQTDQMKQDRPNLAGRKCQPDQSNQTNQPDRELLNQSHHGLSNQPDQELSYHPDQNLTDLTDQQRWGLYSPWLDHADPVVRANGVICLIHQANYLLDQQIDALEQQFIDEGGYSEQLATARLKRRSEIRAQANADNANRGGVELSDGGPATIPHCPLCNAMMALRTAKSGRNAGSQFWGCTQYPHCKGTAPV